MSARIKAASEDGEEEAFIYPDPPEHIPHWATEMAAPWRCLSRFDIEVKAEELSGAEVEIRFADLPSSVWGLQIARDGRACLCINSRLPDHWRRFAIFHELYHLLCHSKGENFWRQTFYSMSRFESEADTFAWAVVCAERELYQ